MSTSWFTERYTAHDLRSHEIRKVLVRKKTRFQHALLAELYSFGRCLILDGELQSAEKDEFIYHEALVQTAMTLQAGATDILVLGGGEGATAREIVRHASVRRVTMVDIDGEVVEFCRTYLRSWHQGALGHPKLRLVIDDAKAFVERSQELFDIIIVDLPTPDSSGPLAALYATPFLRQLRRRLKPLGCLVTQAGSGLQMHFQQELYRRLRKLFKIVRPYSVFVPSFDEPWSFLFASRHLDPLRATAKSVDKRLGTLRRTLKFYDGQTHEGLFRIAKHLRIR